MQERIIFGTASPLLFCALCEGAACLPHLEVGSPRWGGKGWSREGGLWWQRQGGGGGRLRPTSWPTQGGGGEEGTRWFKHNPPLSCFLSNLMSANVLKTKIDAEQKRKKHGTYWYIESTQCHIFGGKERHHCDRSYDHVSLHNLGLDPHPLAEIRHDQATQTNLLDPSRLCFCPGGQHAGQPQVTQPLLSRIAKRKHRCAVPQISFHRYFLCRFYDANHCRHHRKWARRVPWHWWAEAWYSGEEKALLWWGL